MNDLLVLLVAGICFLLGIFTGDIIHILLDEWRGSDNMSLKEDAKLHYDEWCDSCQEYDHNKHCCPRWNRVIKNTVEELKAAQSEPPWIPVTERLPEESGLYQVTDMQGHVVRYVFNANESSVEYWRRCVKAWMPLPESYKGD